MSHVAVLLDKAKKARSIPSDNALGKKLARSRQVVSQWRSGEAYPDEELIAQLAEMAHEDAGEWLLLVRAERSTGQARKAYGSLVRRLGLAALLAIATAPAMAAHFAYSGLGMLIMSARRRQLFAATS